MIKNENYVQVAGWMMNEFKDLRLNEIFIYAAIHGFCQDGKSLFTGSLSYLEDWTHSSKPTVLVALQNLVEKNYIVKLEKIVNNKKYCAYYTVRSRMPNTVNEENQMVKKFDRSKIFTEDGKNSLPLQSNNLTGEGKNSLHNNASKILDKNSAEIPAEGKNESSAAADFILSKIKELFGSNVFDKNFVPELSVLMNESKMEGERIKDYLQSVYERTVSKNPESIPNLFRKMAKAPDVVQNYLLQHPEKKPEEIPMIECPVCYSMTPRYEDKCQCCGFDIWQARNPAYVARERQVFSLSKEMQQDLKKDLEKIMENEHLSFLPADIEKQKQKEADVYKKYGINA